MTVKTCFIIDAQDNIVNGVLWDDETDTEWMQEDFRLVESADPHWHDGYKYNHETKTAFDPNPPPPEPERAVIPESVPNVIT